MRLLSNSVFPSEGSWLDMKRRIEKIVSSFFCWETLVLVDIVVIDVVFVFFEVVWLASKEFIEFNQPCGILSFSVLKY